MSSVSSVPADTEAAPALLRVIDPSGCHTAASAKEAARLAGKGSFAWIDVEETGEANLRQISEILDIGAETVELLLRADRRPSFTPLTDATYAAVPMMDPSGLPTGPRPPYLCLALTGRFLLTRHSSPCPVLQEIRDHYSSLPQDAKTDGPGILFLVLDSLVRGMEPQLLWLDERLNELQMELMTSSPPEIHDEIVHILRILTEAVQGLTWYGSDLDDVAGTIEQLPGMRGGITERFTRHRERVSRMRQSAQNFKEEAKDAFDHYSSNTSNRQGQLINVLTIVATLFLPLTFLTGFFGMNFGVIVNDFNSNVAFVVLGLLLPVASIAITVLLYRRLLRRFGVADLTRPESHLLRRRLQRPDPRRARQ